MRTNDSKIIESTQAVLKERWPHLTAAQAAMLVNEVLAHTSDTLRDNDAYALLAADEWCIAGIVEKLAREEPKLSAKAPSAEEILAAEERERGTPLQPLDRLKRFQELKGLDDDARIELGDRLVAAGDEAPVSGAGPTPNGPAPSALATWRAPR